MDYYWHGLNIWSLSANLKPDIVSELFAVFRVLLIVLISIIYFSALLWYLSLPTALDLPCLFLLVTLHAD